MGSTSALGPPGEAAPTGPGAGVDRVSMMMAVHSAAPDLRRDRHRQMPVGGAAPRIELHGQPGDESVRLDLNPSRVLNPTSTGPLPPEAMAEALDEVASAFELDNLVELEEPLSKARLTRLDAAQDFLDVNHAQTVFEAQLHFPRHRDGAVRAHSARDGGLTGVQVGGKREFCKLYVKDDGRVRFEVQARQDWLDAADISDVEDITPARVDALARRRWDSSLLGMPVVGMDELIERVEASDEKDVIKSRFLGDLDRISMGHVPEWSNDRRSSFYTIQRRLGVALAPGTLGKGRFTIRLDFDTATEVVEGASP